MDPNTKMFSLVGMCKVTRLLISKSMMKNGKNQTTTDKFLKNDTSSRSVSGRPFRRHTRGRHYGVGEVAPHLLLPLKPSQWDKVWR